MTISLAPGSRWTVEELRRLPDDGNRYEIFDGSLLVTPPPDLAHIRVQTLLTRLLTDAAPPHLLPIDAGAGISVKGGTTFYVPDIVVVRREAINHAGAALHPRDVLLVVEVLSPSNRGRDLVLKRHDYAAAGIPHYWIVDPTAGTLTALDLGPDAGGYREAALARAGAAWTTTSPYQVTIDPADLFTTGSWAN